MRCTKNRMQSSIVALDAAGVFGANLSMICDYILL